MNKSNHKNHFNVTQVRVAFECPRLFYLNYHFQGKTLFIPPEHQKGIGNLFHQQAAQFINLLRNNPEFTLLLQQSPLDKEAIATQIQQLYYELEFFSYLQDNQDKNPELLYLIWQGLISLFKKWSELLINNLQFSNINEVITQTFIDEELSLEYDFVLADNSQQKILGKLDSLVFDLGKQRLCVVEYKTYEAVDPSAQLAQVSLYSYMLAQEKKQPVDCVVYCVLPEFKEYYYSWEQLETTVHQLIPYKLAQMGEWIRWEQGQVSPPPMTTQPSLCAICPQQDKCQSWFELSRLKQVSTTSHGLKQVSTTSLEQGEGLVAILQSYNIDVEYLGAAIAPSFVRVKIKPTPGVKVASILKLSRDLQVQLDISHPPLIAPQPGYVSVDLPRKPREIAYLDQYIQKNYIDNSITIAIGVNLEGKLIEADLADPNTCHFLVGGTTGSGKSEFLRSLLLSLIYRHNPQQLKIVLVDPKRITFPEFENIPWLLSPIVKDSDKAMDLMTELVSEMERRYQILEIARCPHISAYNQQKQEDRLPHIVCIFDEYADFMAEKEIRNILEQSIKRLGAMARAAGIHLIIATQRPEASVVTPLIRSNLPGRVALRTASEADSKIILGGTFTEAAYLLGKGDLIYQVGANWQRLQSLYADKLDLGVG